MTFPAVPETVRQYWSDGSPRPISKEALIAEIHSARLDSGERKIAETRLATLCEWHAACAAIDARHGVRALEAQSDKIASRYRKALNRINDTEPRTALGVVIKALVSDDPDIEIDELAEEAGVDVRHALSDMIRRLATDCLPLSAYRG